MLLEEHKAKSLTVSIPSLCSGLQNLSVQHRAGLRCETDFVVS